MNTVSNWRETLFNKDICNGVMKYNSSGDLIIQGKLINPKQAKLYFWAAAPPTFGTSFSGSGMPYPDPSVAYDRTPNKGLVEVPATGDFTINMKYPNAYYVGLGSLYIPPHVNFKVCVAGMEDKYFTIQIDDGIPFRLLTYPAPPSKKPRTQAMFYYEPEKGARSQEAILRASAYPSTNKMPDNFWGERPPR
jgi:hypothetical protein